MSARDAGVCAHICLLRLLRHLLRLQPASLLVLRCYASSLAYEKHTFEKDTRTRTCEKVP